MRTKLGISILCSIMCVSVWAQNIMVRGTVTDKAGAIIGAAVMVKNTNLGTVTNMDGEYELEVPKNGILVFSYLGYNTIEKNVNYSNWY